jgi:2-polyprenyl-3-methyl-5-hydroxy-6-metoxy-1,4-benzoquinol methylase
MNNDFQIQQQLYDKTWREGVSKGKEQRGNLQAAMEFLEKVNMIKKKDRVLEIGCGIGTVVYNLAQKGYDVLGTDISNESIDYGKKKYPGVKLDVQAAEQLPYCSGSFDVVLSFDLFEHIGQSDIHLDEVFRVLRPGGYYLFQTPHKWFSSVGETLISRSFRWRRAHPSLHTPRKLRKRLKKHGFSANFVKINPVNEFSVSKLKRIKWAAQIFTKIDFTRLPVWLQPNLYVVAQKRER